jgi:hypothetical protein
MTSLPAVYADFNNADSRGRLRLNCRGTQDDLIRLNVQFMEDARFSFYMEDLEVDGVVKFSTTEAIWVGQIDWNKIKRRIG